MAYLSKCIEISVKQKDKYHIRLYDLLNVIFNLFILLYHKVLGIAAY